MKRIATNLFGDGISFMIPYHVLYLAGCILGSSTPFLLYAFTGLHILLISGLFYYAFHKRSGFSLSSLLAWSAILLCFLIPGAYIEFPADPWEHVRRTFVFESLQSPVFSDYWYKAVYFFNWTILHPLSLAHRWYGFDLISAFWQVLLSIQVYRLGRALKFNPSMCLLQIVGFFLLFGQNVFSFRYYALSTTPVAYCSYLALLVHFLRLRSGEEKRPRVLWGLCLCLVIALNHLQEILFLIIAIAGFSLERIYTKLTVAPRSKRIKIWIWIAVFLGFSVLISEFLGQQLLTNSKQFSARFLINWAANSRAGIESGYLKPYLVYKVWDLQFFQSIGLVGAFAYLISFVIRKKEKTIFLLTYLPILILVFPPMVFLFQFFLMPETSYRILYAFPLSIAFVYGLTTGWNRVVQIGRVNKVFALVLVFTSIVVVSFPRRMPFRGKLYSQFKTVPDFLSLKNQTELAISFQEKKFRDLLPCIAFVDGPTGFFLNAFLGLNRTEIVPFRLQRVYWDQKILTSGLAKYFTEHSCGLLLPNNFSLDPRVDSKFGRMSNHWDPKLADPAYHIDFNLLNAIVDLKALGWREYSVGVSHKLLLPKVNF